MLMSVPRAFAEPEPDHDVHDDRRPRDADHQAAIRDARIPDPVDRFPANQQRDEHQRHGVGEGRQDADPVVAKGHPVVRPLVRDGQRVPAEAERGGVGQVVAGIGKQRETWPEPPAQRLDGHEREREDERGAQRPLGHSRRECASGRGRRELSCA